MQFLMNKKTRLNKSRPFYARQLFYECKMAAPVRLELTTLGLTVRASHSKMDIFDRKTCIFAPFSYVKTVQSQPGPNFYGPTFYFLTVTYF